MATITEDYVSYEVAKLLKEKGFDEACIAVYEEEVLRTNTLCDYHNSELSSYVCAPTHQIAMKWLRERGIYITIVYGDYPSLNKVFWTPQIDSIEGFDLPDSFYKEYEEYEQAVEAALKYSLENLI